MKMVIFHSCVIHYQRVAIAVTKIANLVNITGLTMVDIGGHINSSWVLKTNRFFLGGHHPVGIGNVRT